MLRRLEKGLNDAKMKSQATLPLTEAHLDGLNQAHVGLGHLGSADGRQYRDSDMRSPMYNGPQPDRPYQGHASGSTSLDDDNDDGEPVEEGMYPARLIKKERQRNSFFGTVLGPSAAGRTPENGSSPATSALDRPPSYSTDTPSPLYSIPQANAPLDDPVKRGLMDEATAENIFDMVLIRLNPFINLFDPELHTASYVRKKCPFLYTTLLMAGSKFFKPQVYPEIRQIAEQHAVRVFAELRKSVEIVQAFMCLTYWKEPTDDGRTWTYIGFACRMAVELGLNRYTSRPNPHETNLQRLERRNRERAYLVLFVHDRSLSMQTGRLWMLPEDDLVIESEGWHEQVPQGSIRPEDVILAAFVSLRQIAVETTKMFELQKNSSGTAQQDNFDFLLNACNLKLASWAAQWTQEMKRAHGESFHHSFLEFFQLYVGLFLNSFGIHAYLIGSNGPPPSLQALGTCYANASRCLEIIVKEFARVQMLQYSQESITVMTAYCAVMLLRLLRKSNKTDSTVFSLILNAAEAYKEAGAMMSSSSSCIFHARFLKALVEREVARARQQGTRDLQDGPAIDPALQDVAMTTPASSMNPTTYPLPTPGPESISSGPTSPHNQGHPSPPSGHMSEPYYFPQGYGGHSGQQHVMSSAQGDKNMVEAQMYAGGVANSTQQQADHFYYHNMCRELGVSEGADLMQYNMMYFRERGVGGVA